MNIFYYATKTHNQAGRRQDTWTRRGSPWWWADARDMLADRLRESFSEKLVG